MRRRLVSAMGRKQILSQRIGRDLLVVGDVARQAAFEEGEGVDRERLGGEAGLALEEAGDLARAAALPAGQRDVRVKGAALGIETDGDASALNLGGECGERLLRLDASP